MDNPRLPELGGLPTFNQSLGFSDTSAPPRFTGVNEATEAAAIAAGIDPDELDDPAVLRNEVLLARLSRSIAHNLQL